MIIPTLIDDNFLTPRECDHVYSRVLFHEDKWVNIKDTDMTAVNTVDTTKHKCHFFGPSVYSLYKNFEVYNEKKTFYNEILSSEFGDIYVKLKDEVSRVLGKPTYYCDDVAYPGFHIFGPGLKDESIKYDYFHYHYDRYPDHFKNIIPYSEVYSFIIPIRLPVAGASLDYNETKKFLYKTGSLSYWHGEVAHKISDFVLQDETDYRITWQIHVAVLKDIAIMFW